VITRREWSGYTSLGDALEEFPASDPTNAANDPSLQALSAQAHLIVQIRDQLDGVIASVGDADEEPDYDAITSLLQQMASATATFQSMKAARGASNPYVLSAGDQAMLDLGNWAQGFIQALPSAIGALPNALVNAAGQVLQNTGSQLGTVGLSALGGLLPWLAIGALGLVALTQFRKVR
jgi:hypothetical protein